MRKLYWYVFGLMFLTDGAMAQKSFELKVNIENIAAPAKLILTVKAVGEWKEYSAESDNGHFEITGAMAEPSFAFLVMKYESRLNQPPDADNVSEIFLENKTILIQGKNSLKSAEIRGGDSQRELVMLKNSISAFRPDQQNERAKIVSDFVMNHPNSYVSVYALQDFNMDGSFRLEVEKVSPLLAALSTTIRKSLSGKELDQDIKLAKRTALGSVAPDFVQTDTLQRAVSLQSFRGKYVLIDFWASWCRPCRIENPELVKAFQLYKDKGFTILGVSLDNNRNSWTKAIRKDGLEWVHVSDLKFWKNEVANLYGVKSIPQNFIIDPTGKIVGRNIHAKELASWLKERIQ